MTTVFQFAPSPLAPFQFQPTLDGATYSAVVTWNTFGQRWYLNLYSLDGTLVVCEALIGSGDPINLASLSWANGIATATLAVPSGWKIGSVIELTIAGCVPDAYNGSVLAAISNDVTFTYPIADDPGGTTQLGVASYDIDLVWPYFASTLVFRESSQQFEVNP